MLVPYALLAQVALLSQFVASQPAAVPTYGQSGTTKEFTTLDGRTYIYDFVSAKSAAKPTLLLLHGYPSSRHDWDHQVTALAAEGFGVVSLDLLGFGDTSKPTAIEAYNTKLFSDNLAHILDAEGLQTVIGVGHDWGAQLLAKAVAWYPERFSKLAFVSVPYAPAGKFLDVDAINKLSLETVGFAQFGFWYFFNAWDAAALMRRNLESYFHLVFATNASAWGVNFANLGAARAWLTANTTTELPTWLSAEYKANWLRQYSQPDALEASLNHYQASMRGVNAPDEAVLADTNRTLRVPVLVVAAAKDQLFSPEALRAATEPWASAGFEQRVVDAGHWVPMEKGEELSEILVEFAGS